MNQREIEMNDGSIEEFDGMSLIEWNNYNPYQHGDVLQFRKEQANWF